MTDGSSSSPHKEARLTVFCRISAAYLPGPHRGVPSAIFKICAKYYWGNGLGHPGANHHIRSAIISGSGGISQDIAD